MKANAPHTDRRLLPETFRLALVRHAQSTANVAGRFSGTTDVRLTSLGRHMAVRICANSELSQIEHVFCSPSTRALETARMICHDKDLPPPTVKDGFSELSFGDWEGQNIHTVCETPRYRKWSENPFVVPPPSGETGLDLLARAFATLCDVLEENANIAIVTHKTPARLLSAVLTGQNPMRYRKLTGYSVSSVTSVAYREGSLLRYVPANVSHLPETWRSDPDRLTLPISGSDDRWEVHHAG